MFTPSKKIQCPYCGEYIDVIVDVSVPIQQYIEDCSVCCRPIEIEVIVDADVIAVMPKRDDE